MPARIARTRAWSSVSPGYAASFFSFSSFSKFRFSFCCAASNELRSIQVEDGESPGRKARTLIHGGQKSGKLQFTEPRSVPFCHCKAQRTLANQDWLCQGRIVSRLPEMDAPGLNHGIQLEYRNIVSRTNRSHSIDKGEFVSMLGYIGYQIREPCPAFSMLFPRFCWMQRVCRRRLGCSSLYLLEKRMEPLALTVLSAQACNRTSRLYWARRPCAARLLT